MKRKRDPIVRRRERDILKKRNKWYCKTPKLQETTDVRHLLVQDDAIPFITDELRMGWLTQELATNSSLRDRAVEQLPLDFIRKEASGLGVKQHTIQHSDDNLLLNIGRLRWLQNERAFLDARCEAFRTLELLKSWGFTKIGTLTKWTIPMYKRVFSFQKVTSTVIELRNIKRESLRRLRIVRFLAWYEKLGTLLNVHLSKLVIEYAYDFKTEMVRRLLK